MPRKLLILLLLLSISSFGGFRLSDRAIAESPSDAHREGLEYHKQGKTAEAVRAFRSASDEGDAAAIGFLGWMYLEGKGVPKSPWIAYGHFREAAERGDGPACLNLGTMHFNGIAAEQCYGQAVRWWEKGAALGEYRSADRLAHLLYSGDGATVDRQRAIELWGAASHNSPPDDRKPAISLAFSQIESGDPKIVAQAREDLEDLSRAGHSGAVDAMKYLAARDNPDVLMLDVPHIQQARNYCAPTSAAMMLRYQGEEASQFRVQQLCPNTAVGDGVYWCDLLAAMGRCGGNWELKTYEPTDRGFAEAKALVIEELASGRPIIIDWFDKTNAHTVLLCGYDCDAKEFFFRDPGLSFPGIHVRSESWLQQNWATKGFTRDADQIRRAAIRILPRLIGREE